MKYDVTVVFPNGNGLSSKTYRDVEVEAGEGGVDIKISKDHQISYSLSTSISIEIKKARR